MSIFAFFDSHICLQYSQNSNATFFYRPTQTCTAKKKDVEAKRAAAAEAAAKKKQEAEAKKTAAQAKKTVEKAPPGATINLFGGMGGGGKAAAPPPTPKPAPAARKTISLFGVSGDDAPKPKAKTAPTSIKKTPSKPAAKKAPAGIPSLVKWKKNRDGSVTGFISGSPAFDEGEKVTTSPITQGDLSAGQVVQTGSGSRYFLV